MSAEIAAIGMVTPVGLDALASAAAIRAGISGVRRSSHRDSTNQKIAMGLVPTVRGSRYERAVTLGAAALSEVMEGAGDRPIALLLGTPEDVPSVAIVPSDKLLADIVARSGAPIDRAASASFPKGRAAGMIALREALRRIEAREADRVIVGGADSHADDGLLAALERRGRLKTADGKEGIIPGESAAFVMITAVGAAAAAGRAPWAALRSAALGEERGHVGSPAPFTGDGLHAAVRDALAAVPNEPVRTVYTGLTGDHLSGKEWGVAAIRAGASLAKSARIEHPVDCLGDPGAALGPLLVGLSAVGVARGYRKAPCLVWCSSEGATRGAAIIT